MNISGSRCNEVGLQLKGVRLTYYPARTGQPGTNRTVDFSYDAMARLQSVRSGWDWNINTYQDVAGSAVYNRQGALTSLSILGSTETRQYNALGQLTRIQGLGLNIEYRFSATQNDGKITQQKNWVSGEEVTYQYDELERLSSAATTGPEWGLAWTYDGFGNRLAQNLTKGTGPTMTTLVDANTNRLSGFGYSYDANGNLTNMPQQNAQMTYDSSNRMTRFSNLNDAESYQYAPDNKRVWRSKGCSYYNYANGQNEPRPQIIFYSVFGQKLGEYCLMDEVTVVREYVYFGGRMVARSWGASWESFKTDRLHSNQDAPGGGFFPYGETKSGAATTGESFATYSRDWHGLDYADQRWYLPGFAAFATVDPAQPGDSAQPWTWNYYAYVGQDPINFSDPTGLVRCGDMTWAANGSTVRSIMTGSGNALSYLAQLVWHEPGPVRQSEYNNFSLYLHEQNTIATVMGNRWDLARGLLTGYGNDGESYEQQFGSSQSTFERIILAGGGNNTTWGLWTHGKLKATIASDLDAILNSDIASGPQMALASGGTVNSGCWAVLTSIRTAGNVVNGARYNPANALPLYWNLQSPGAQHNDDKKTINFGKLRNLGNTFHGISRKPLTGVRGETSLLPPGQTGYPVQPPASSGRRSPI
jgi:RHS repeat-associated protein